MTSSHRHALFCGLISLAVLPLLTACENSATSMIVENKDHALVLIREQPYFWSDKVEQYIVVSRLPTCQRRIKIHQDSVAMNPVDVYDAGPLLWALRQGGQWYLASTERCQVQDWNNSGNRPPGPAVGNFERRDGKTVFTLIADPAPSPNP
ncbi:MAG: hypothetical protein FWD67_08945 [Betaproteobacteria bacterium]|nr:hypothetical protein [Betaproteobacteria bacterium]